METSDLDKEFIREANQAYRNDLAATLEKEARKGLNPNKDFGKTQREIDNEKASLECDGPEMN